MVLLLLDSKKKKKKKRDATCLQAYKPPVVAKLHCEPNFTYGSNFSNVLGHFTAPLANAAPSYNLS